MTNKIADNFGGRLRIRVCGLALRHDSILLIRHEGVGKGGYLWAPPGGEVHYQEDLHQALQREFKEETNLDIEVKDFLAVNEFNNGPLHAIELFFTVDTHQGEPVTGSDPELSEHDQVIKEVRYVTFSELNQLSDDKKHNLLHREMNQDALLNMKGHFKLWQ